MDEEANTGETNTGETTSGERESGLYKKLSSGNMRVPLHVAKSMAKARRKSQKTKPKPLYFWTNSEVVKWLKRSSDDLHDSYCHLFAEHDITGRSLVRLNDAKLEQLGITDPSHRDDMLKLILKLKLKNELIELKNLEQKAKT